MVPADMAKQMSPQNFRRTVFAVLLLLTLAAALVPRPDVGQPPAANPEPTVLPAQLHPISPVSGATVPTPADSPAVVRPVETPPLPPVFATFPIVAEERRATADPNESEVLRVVRAPIKYPWVRVRSRVRLDAAQGSWIVLAEEAAVADQLLVRPQPGVTPAMLQAALAPAGVTIREALHGSDTLLLQLPAREPRTIDETLAALTPRTDLFLRVDVNGIGFGATNDPRFGAQWALSNTGQTSGSVVGVVGVDVNANGLWSIAKSAPKVLVAVLDSGIDFAHQDLGGVAWTNPGEIAGNGLDDDGNGRVDDVNGWDFVNADNSPADDLDHGSHVTGIIAARRDNGIGIAGMADPASILPVKILNSSNFGLTNDLIAGLDYARLLGARVINLSLQNYPNNGSLADAMNRAQAADIVVCACAGNQGANNDAIANYPSSFSNANVIAVGNHDRTDVRWTGSLPSNYGALSVDLFAPGREVVSTVRNNLYSAFTGTSMACPHVVAVAAIIRALNPDWNALDVKSCILQTVVPRPAYSTICVTGGRLNAEAAIKRAIFLRPDNDSDGDQFPNLLEYAVGSDPLFGSTAGVPVAQLQNGFLELTYTRPRSDISYLVEASEDFLDWSSATVNQGGVGTTVTASSPVGVETQLYLRLKVSTLP